MGVDTKRVTVPLKRQHFSDSNGLRGKDSIGYKVEEGIVSGLLAPVSFYGLCFGCQRKVLLHRGGVFRVTLSSLDRTSGDCAGGLSGFWGNF